LAPGLRVFDPAVERVMPEQVLCIVGTRPEGIKMAPVILALRDEPDIDLVTVSTGQHREMLNQVLEFFGVKVDEDLNLMQPNQTLADLTARSLQALDRVLAERQPKIVVAQGDTTTVATAALAAFYRKIPFAHVEAGLRTHDLLNPFPEELNRVIAGKLANLHFPPTQRAADVLREERVAEENIVLTGNTVIDALLQAVAKKPPLPFDLPEGKRIVLVTLHRRESFGHSVQDVCNAVRRLTEKFPDIHVVWPVHLNPNVREPVRKAFADSKQVQLCDPLPYNHFVATMNRADLILTDSGGVQEEAPALGKPVLVLREVTERPEAVEYGVVELVGTDEEKIVASASKLLSDADAYAKMARGVSPYGDGKASARIVAALRKALGLPAKAAVPPLKIEVPA
jgi:UDP-N-acetylglucosamine 2-epimerase (non-hydrolysing)